MKRKMPKLRKFTGNGVFKWTDAHYNKLERIKNSVREHIKLSPFNVKKPVHIHIDASQESLSYLLSHLIEDDKEDSYRMKRQLITLGFTGLTETQSRYSTIELETLALVFAVSKLDY